MVAGSWRGASGTVGSVVASQVGDGIGDGLNDVADHHEDGRQHARGYVRRNVDCSSGCDGDSASVLATAPRASLQLASHHKWAYRAGPTLIATMCPVVPHLDAPESPGPEPESA
jgi:hypothetical protein